MINKLPHFIDPQLIFGRNIELQRLVQYLFSEQPPNNRFIHVYGDEGVGKSAISTYAAKYTLDRKKFPDGVYYVEL